MAAIHWRDSESLNSGRGREEWRKEMWTVLEGSFDVTVSQREGSKLPPEF